MEELFEKFKQDNITNFNQYDYLSDRTKFRLITKFAKSIGISDSKLKIGHVIYQNRLALTIVYFMNDDNQEIAYASIDLFPLSGVTKHESPRVWSKDLLESPDYFTTLPMREDFERYYRGDNKPTFSPTYYV